MLGPLARGRYQDSPWGHSGLNEILPQITAVNSQANFQGGREGQALHGGGEVHLETDAATQEGS